MTRKSASFYKDNKFREVINLNVEEASADKLDEEIKIGKFVLHSLKKLFSEKIIPQELLQDLLDKNYCKEMINVNYPLLVQVNKNKSLREQTMINEKPRYWLKDIVDINGGSFAICSQWYDWHNQSFKDWFNKVNNKLVNK